MTSFWKRIWRKTQSKVSLNLTNNFRFSNKLDQKKAQLCIIKIKTQELNKLILSIKALEVLMLSKIQIDKENQ